jgi:hypothetical protein
MFQNWQTDTSNLHMNKESKGICKIIHTAVTNYCKLQVLKRLMDPCENKMASTLTVACNRDKHFFSTSNELRKVTSLAWFNSSTKFKETIPLPMHCLVKCSNFWPLKTWYPTILTRLIWPLVISSCWEWNDNRVSFQGFLRNSGTITNRPTRNSKMSVPVVLKSEEHNYLNIHRTWTTFFLN